jgi:hypothetical protein
VNVQWDKKIKYTLMKCHTNINCTPFTQLPHTFSYIVAILIPNHFESPNTKTLTGICTVHFVLQEMFINLAKLRYYIFLLPIYLFRRSPDYDLYYLFIFIYCNTPRKNAGAHSEESRCRAFSHDVTRFVE